MRFSLCATCFVLGLPFAAGCSPGCSKKPEPVEAGLVTPSASVERQTQDDIHSVYPEDAGPIDPDVARFCARLHEFPEERKAACCGTRPTTLPTAECRRTLGAATNSKAAKLKTEAIDACVSALERTYQGCDWVGPFPPALPPECMGVVEGTLASGARCRSSLECGGHLRCHGVGPTTMGTCGPAKPAGDRCGGSSDVLATYARQDDADRRHPECAGWCNRGRCEAAIAEGQPCIVQASCGEGLHCVMGKCSRAALPKPGEACGAGQCADGALCLAGKCVARKPAGESCTSDFECIGGCLRDGGPPVFRGRDASVPQGTCGQKCLR